MELQPYQDVIEQHRTVALRNEHVKLILLRPPGCEGLLYIKFLFSQYFLQYLQPPSTDNTHTHTITPSVWRTTFTKHKLSPVTCRSISFFLKNKTEHTRVKGNKLFPVQWVLVCFFNNKTRTPSLTQVKCNVNAVKQTAKQTIRTPKRKKLV